MAVPTAHPNHYETLGLGCHCSSEEIRNAYRRLARRHHPDANRGSADSVARSQALNAAYEVLRDPARRRAYDEEMSMADDRAHPVPAVAAAPRTKVKPITRDVRLTIEELLRGISLTLDVMDPASMSGPETCHLDIPEGTAPKAKFKVPRPGPDGGQLVVTIGLRPHPRFKARGSDLRCDLRLSPERATNGGTESLTGPEGRPLRVQIPAHVARGETVRLTGQGLPRARGGRGDLVVRVMYRPEVTLRFQRKG